MTPPSVLALTEAIRAAFLSMEAGPKPLLKRIHLEMDEGGFETPAESEIVSFIVDSDVNSAQNKAAHMAIANWDVVTDAPWADGTDVGNHDRRNRIFDLLKIDSESRKKLDAAFPSYAVRDVMIAAPGEWEPWYSNERRASNFYWRAYRGVLERKDWTPDAIAELNESTSRIISRLADPAASKSYSSRGLVVGYVQSGKTANFTGIIAKAIDSGYRLVIVLTGTIELLRGQTQRRLDMELVGEENILGGRNKDDPNAVRDIDYAGTGDTDWIGNKFLRHGIAINDRRDIPSVIRLTSLGGDYKSLKAGLDTLDFRRTGELVNPAKPVYDPENIFGTSVRLAVIKKNKTVLEKLLNDLGHIHADLGEIPTLIIDDEADQASVNTTSPRQKTAATDDEKSRTTINRLISQILKQMPRAQYIGYTATPFANVFVEPDDQADIFPRDFIMSLEPSRDYMGGRSFHDLDVLPRKELDDPKTSNAAAHVRDLYAPSSDDDEGRRELTAALDAFVVTGAIKLWRQANTPKATFKHHTMLVHETVKQEDHKELAKLIRDLWYKAAFTDPGSLSRLKALYEGDFLRVHDSRDNWESEMPAQFEELIEYVGETVRKVMLDNDPIVIVNGSKESDYNAMDFTVKDYWRIMVGGTKLSRGFTIEGLTITYYRRRAMAADTLMQMGRWFGYRPGYKDLVRLYIARDVTDARGKTYDLYDAFTAIIEDEEAFREQLRMYAEVDPESNRPAIRPIDVPPLVYQQLPWLKPTSGNKMYNAVVDYEGDGGRLRDFPRQADRDRGEVNVGHFRAVQPWLGQLGEALKFEYIDARPDGTRVTRKFDARTVIVSASEVHEALRQFQWTSEYSFDPTLSFMKTFHDQGKLEDFVIVVPHLEGVKDRNVDGQKLQLLRRVRREAPRGGFSGSSFRQRAAIERIAGNVDAPGGQAAIDLSTPTRGALLLTFAADPELGKDRSPDNLRDPIDLKDIATLFSIAMPYAAAPRGRFGFRVIDKSQAQEAIIDV